jgi:hypothetical protein
MKTNRFTLCRGSILAACSMAMFFAAAGPQKTSAQSSTEGQLAAQQSGAALSRIPARVTQKVDDQNVSPLHGGVHRMARTEFDRGAVPDSQPVNHLILTLKRSKDQDAALRQLLVEQQDKTSKNYHAWLSPDRFGKQFGPADSDVQAVTDWLTSRGFSDIKVSPGRTRVEFSGNIGQVRNAFHTEVHHFMVRGKMHMAAVSDVQVPTALAPVVAGVVSLHDFRPKAHTHKLGTFRRNKETGEVKPLFTFTGCGSSGAQPCYAVGPGDFAKIYNVPVTVTGPAPLNVVAPSGTGATIGIVQDSNLNVADVKAYRAIFGLPDNFSASNIVLNGPDPGIQGPDSFTDDEIEADLDVQVAGGVAPAANIQLVVSQDSLSIGMAGVDLSAIYIIDNNSADILSESFGACEPNITAAGEVFYNDLWQQAAAQGITVVLSSGDSGSDSCDQGGDEATTGLSVSGLASTEFNVAVGGTDFLNGAPPSPFWNVAGSATTSAKGYIPETTWNNSCASTAIAGTLTTCSAGPDPSGIDLVAAGGGPSAINAKPIWQTGTPGNPADTFRDLPDISLFAGNGFNGSFYIICQTDQNAAFGGDPNSCDLNSPFQNFQGVGGTSAGAPAFAGIMALVKQKTGNRVGNANFVLYKMFKTNAAGTICASSATPAATCIFYDTPATPVGTTGANISVACQGGTPNCSTATAGQTGVLVDPAHTTTPAWITTANYDLATGLGSVNVTNLVNAWPSITFTASTVSITSPTTATTITHGTPVAFDIAVTPTSATGAVALVAQPSKGTGTGASSFSDAGIGQFSESTSTTLTGGSATITTSQLPGGTSYPVFASYNGDGIVAAGRSSPVTVTVTPENSFTVVSLIDGNANPQTTVPYGSPYILQVAVQDSGHNLCSQFVVACPSGTITLKDNGSALNDFAGSNTAKLNSIGIAEDQPVQLSTGAHSLVATYSGDNSFNGSTSAAAGVTITKATPTGISVKPTSSSVAANQNVGLTATIATSSSGVGPTGMVTFSSGSTTLGTAAVTGLAASGLNGANPMFASGTATFVTKFTTAGAQSVTATYSGDTNYNSVGPSAGATVTVTGGTVVTTTAVTPSATTINLGISVTLSATVTSSVNNGPGITNTVQFLSGSTLLGNAVNCTPTAGTAATPATCTASVTTTSLPAGANSITASYNGNATYAASTSAAVTVTVNGTSTTTAVTPSVTTLASGSSITFTATVTGASNAGAAPSGTIQFMNGTTPLGSAATCTAASATTCTATLTTTLSSLPPSLVRGPRNTPNLPLRPVYILTVLLFLSYLLTLRLAPPAKRLRYAYLGVVLFACATIGIAGCGGGSSGGGGGGGVTPHNDTITAVYSGDARYNGSTSAAVSISIH